MFLWSIMSRRRAATSRFIQFRCVTILLAKAKGCKTFIRQSNSDRRRERLAAEPRTKKHWFHNISWRDGKSYSPNSQTIHRANSTAHLLWTDDLPHLPAT